MKDLGMFLCQGNVQADRREIMLENDLSTCGQSVQILFIDFVLYDGIRILSLYRSCYINFEYIKKLCISCFESG